MEALYQNALLYAIGWAILHSFWQMALAWMTFQVLFGFRKRTGPEFRYIGAVALLGTGGVLFLLTTLYEYRSALAMGPMVRALSISGADATPNSGWSAFMDNTALLAERFMPYLSSAYLIILFFLAARLWSAWLQTRDIRRNGLTPLEEPWTDEVRRIAEQLGLGEIGIFLSDRVEVPVTLGHLRPLILLPVATLNYLTIDQARAVLLHEIAHIRRRDYLVNIGVSVIGTLLFFNPFVHVLSASLRRDREMCCDDFVLQCRQDAGDYARALMSLEQFRSGLSPAMVMAATGQKGQLLNRVKRILDINNGRAGYGQRLIAFLFLAGLLSTFAWMAPDALTGPNAEPASTGVTIARKETATASMLSVSGQPKEPARLMIQNKTRVNEDARPIDEEELPLALVDRPHVDFPVLETPATPPPPVPGPFAPFDLRAQAFQQLQGMKFMDERSFIRGLQPFGQDIREEYEEVEQPNMVLVPAEGQDLSNLFYTEDVKVDRTVKTRKSVMDGQQYLIKHRAALEEAKRYMSMQRMAKARQQSQEWQKKVVELAELDRMLRSEINIPEAVFEVPAAPEAEKMITELGKNSKFRFTFSNAPKLKSQPRKGVVAMSTTSGADQAITITGELSPIAEVSAAAEEPAQHAKAARRPAIVTTNVDGTKGMRIIVVEQEPRNIEIRLERD